MRSERFLPGQEVKPYFEHLQLQKMRLTALYMEYMQAYGRNDPDGMNKAVSEMRGIMPLLGEIAHKVRVANDQNKK